MKRILISVAKGFVFIWYVLFYKKKNSSRDAYYTPWFLNIQFRGVKPLRIYFWRKCGISIGQDCYLSNNLKIIAPNNIRIGSNSKILNKSILDGRGGISIGKYVQVGFESIILSSSHEFKYKDKPISEQGMIFDEVKIESNVWIGARVMILSGVAIADNVIVGAMSVVSRNLEDSSIYAGIPAKKLKPLY